MCFLWFDTLGIGADEASKGRQETTYGFVPGGNQKVGRHKRTAT
jgi:hypothetical protein